MRNLALPLLGRLKPAPPGCILPIMRRDIQMNRVSLPAGMAVLVAASFVLMSAQRPDTDAVRIDNDDIGGVVTGANGPEAGAWVIAETSDLRTKYAKIVVTDDRGR